MSSNLESQTLNVKGKLSMNVSLKGKIENSTLNLVGKVEANKTSYYKTANEYGYTVYIG